MEEEMGIGKQRDRDRRMGDMEDMTTINFNLICLPQLVSVSNGTRTELFVAIMLTCCCYYYYYH